MFPGATNAIKTEINNDSTSEPSTTSKVKPVINYWENIGILTKRQQIPIVATCAFDSYQH